MKKILFYGLLAAILGLTACSSKDDLKTGRSYAKGPKCDVKWVQLWKGGPKFAEYNVGATAETDYGGLYCWGSSRDKGSNDAYTDGTAALTGTDDTASNLWGDNWRMPTKDDFDKLLANCYVEWTTVGGVYGCIFTGKDDYASSSVFLPATGRCENGGVFDLDLVGYYWSSTPNENLAYYLDFDSCYQIVGSSCRGFGHSVRAVLAE